MTNDLANHLSAALSSLSGRQELGRPRFKDGVLSIGGQRVEVSPVSENSTTMHSRFVEAARFEVRIDSALRPELAVGAIGIGESRDDALQTAVHEWMGSFGLAFLSALAGVPTELRMGDALVHPGLLGIRGERPVGTWVDGSDTMHKLILEKLKAALPRTPVRSLHTIDLKVMVKLDRPVDGEARFDAETSEAMLSAMKSLEWPKSTSFMFKQTYVLRDANIVPSAPR